MSILRNVHCNIFSWHIFWHFLSDFHLRISWKKNRNIHVYRKELAIDILWFCVQFYVKTKTKVTIFFNFPHFFFNMNYNFSTALDPSNLKEQVKKICLKNCSVWKKLGKNKKGKIFVWAAPKMVSFFSAASCKKETIFGAAHTKLGAYYFFRALLISKCLQIIGLQLCIPKVYLDHYNTFFSQ